VTNGVFASEHTIITVVNSKQLANVLIKILGLSICLQAIPAFVSGFLRGFISGLQAAGSTRAASVAGYAWTYALGSAVYFAVGIFLIFGSRFVADKLFKNDHE
jgi:hypothetical protein